MKKSVILFIFIISLVSSSCFFSSLFKRNKETIVLINTSFGEMKVKLYKETPLHRENFIKLVSDKFYDSLLFHRVIKGFMIQGGDPDSKNEFSDIILGNGGPGYTIPAEFNSKYFHKKGAIAAARKGDDRNPGKESSGSQFYIVQGKVFTDAELDKIEKRIYYGNKRDIFNNYLNSQENKALKIKIDSLRKEKNILELGRAMKEVENKLQEEYNKLELFEFTEEQRKIYTTIGGSPHLDGDYTVFGEVIEGIKIIEKITSVKTENNNRPVEDIKMTIKIINATKAQRH